jgi:hypothetical protein
VGSMYALIIYADSLFSDLTFSVLLVFASERSASSVLCAAKRASVSETESGCRTKTDRTRQRLS